MSYADKMRKLLSTRSAVCYDAAASAADCPQCRTQLHSGPLPEETDAAAAADVDGKLAATSSTQRAIGHRRSSMIAS